MAAGWDCHVHVFDAAAPVRAGHYEPAHRPLQEIEALAAAHGIGHLVLVQPSVYGTDNQLLLRALAAHPGRHRGVVVVDADVSEHELASMQTAGVRGVRFNWVSPVGVGDDPGERFAALAPRLRALGWHVQWYVPRERLARVAALHRGSGLVAVLDHLGGMSVDTRDDDPAWDALRALADAGAWVKLSGWYRLGTDAPYAALAPNLRRVMALFGPRVAWGSDWPHTSFARAAAPKYEVMHAPLRHCLGAEEACRLVERRPAIYA